MLVTSYALFPTSQKSAIPTNKPKLNFGSERYPTTNIHSDSVHISESSRMQREHSTELQEKMERFGLESHEATQAFITRLRAMSLQELQGRKKQNIESIAERQKISVEDPNLPAALAKSTLAELRSYAKTVGVIGWDSQTIKKDSLVRRILAKNKTSQDEQGEIQRQISYINNMNEYIDSLIKNQKSAAKKERRTEKAKTEAARPFRQPNTGAFNRTWGSDDEQDNELPSLDEWKK